MKKKLLVGALALSLLGTPAVLTANQNGGIIRDGKYDNHAAFVDESKYSMQEVVDSVDLIVHSVTYGISYETQDGVVKAQTLPIATTGTGVVIEKKDGKAYMLTNYHVTDIGQGINIQTAEPVKWLKAEKLSEELYIQNGTGVFATKIQAKRVAGDKTLDAAILEMDDCSALKKFPYKIGDSDNLEQGDFFYAIGNPLGLLDYVQHGHISQLETKFNDDWMMLGASVVPGNSGGPIVGVKDGEYELVGLVNATLIRSPQKPGEFMPDTIPGFGIGIKINSVMELYDKYQMSVEIKQKAEAKAKQEAEEAAKKAEEAKALEEQGLLNPEVPAIEPEKTLPVPDEVKPEAKTDEEDCPIPGVKDPTIDTPEGTFVNPEVYKPSYKTLN